MITQLVYSEHRQLGSRAHIQLFPLIYSCTSPIHPTVAKVIFIKFKLYLIASVFVAFQEVPEVKNLSANPGDLRDSRFDPWVRKIPWRRKWQLTPVLLPGKFHGQRSLSSYSPWGHKESDRLKCLRMHAHLYI